MPDGGVATEVKSAEVDKKTARQPKVVSSNIPFLRQSAEKAVEQQASQEAADHEREEALRKELEAQANATKPMDTTVIERSGVRIHPKPGQMEFDTKTGKPIASGVVVEKEEKSPVHDAEKQAA